MQEVQFDVAIIGGGPAGSCCGSLLKKYMPDCRVVILEREKFPRDHIGESLLPIVPQVIHEMGAWDKVEAAEFPIKIGATCRWGKKRDLWDFEFLPTHLFREDQRPGTFEGQRVHTTWQVYRPVFDEILLDHAAELGCDVREETKVVEVKSTGDHVDGLVLQSGETIRAKQYVDASGVSSILRKALGVEADYPTSLRNIAIWDYWDNADWAVKVGAGGTRILVVSIDWGWLWFIPIAPTKTSLGLVLPLEHYKKSGERPEDLYAKAVKQDPLIAELIRKATRENVIRTTNDWSYIADRLAGENWYLAGDSCGFADPILSAGLTLAMFGARQVAYSIIAEMQGSHDGEWLKSYYSDKQRSQILQHIKFADFWYSSNGAFTDLVDYCKTIAKESGHDMSSNAAFGWMATGGFTNDDPVVPMLGGFAIQAVKIQLARISQTRATWKVSEYNVFKLDLEGAEESTFPVFSEGKVWTTPCYKRNGKLLPNYGMFGLVIKMLQEDHRIVRALQWLENYFYENPKYPTIAMGMDYAIATLEAMIDDGWVTCDKNKREEFIVYDTPAESATFHTNQDIVKAFGL